MAVYKPINPTRIILSLLAAPLVTPTVFLLYQVTLKDAKTPIDTMVGVYLNYGFYSYLVTLLLGIPVLYVLHRANLRKLIYFILGGAMLGLIPATIIGVIGVGKMSIYILCLVSGLLSAVVFWVLSGWGNVNAVRTCD